MPTVAGRLTSLDVFRGITMASMVMVNNQREGAYAPLRHAQWDGITFTDLVFPFFLWIVGVAFTFSTARRMEQGEDRAQLLRHAVKRAAIIFGIGLLMNGFPTYNLATLRIPGVLQRIALAYLAATAIFLYTELRGRILWTVGLMMAYFLLMQPGGYLPDSNLSDRLDRMLLSGHLYTPTRDPEGTVSTLTAIATCMFGILTGHILRARMAVNTKLAWMLGGGAFLLVLGFALDPFQPINKNLWTNTYTLVAAGLASIVFGLTYWICDVRNLTGRWSQPFVMLGMNAMAVYIFHGLLGRVFPMAGLRTPIYEAFARVLNTPNASLAYSLVHVAASFLFAWLLYRQRWFLKF
jgi:predicted acyltransferase